MAGGLLGGQLRRGGQFLQHLCISALDGFILNSGTKALPDLLINDEVQPRTKPAHRLVVFKGR